MTYSKCLIDTDVIIDYLRDIPQAIKFMESLSPNQFLSVITVAELHSGMRDSEQKQIEQFLQAFQTLPITHDIAILGGQFKRQYGKSHGTGLADALIAATAHSQNAILVTLNQRHFPMMTAKILVPYKK